MTPATTDQRHDLRMLVAGLGDAGRGRLLDALVEAALDGVPVGYSGLLDRIEDASRRRSEERTA